LKNQEIDTARRNIETLVAEIDQARRGFAAKDAELDAARGNIDALVAEIDRARQAHSARDAVEAALRAELTLLRQSRWFRLGRVLRLIDRDRS
jgi:soluble cytochrome b562